MCIRDRVYLSTSTHVSYMNTKFIFYYSSPNLPILYDHILFRYVHKNSVPLTALCSVNEVYLKNSSRQFLLYNSSPECCREIQSTSVIPGQVCEIQYSSGSWRRFLFAPLFQPISLLDKNNALHFHSRKCILDNTFVRDFLFLWVFGDYMKGYFKVSSDRFH